MRTTSKRIDSYKEVNQEFQDSVTAAIGIRFPQKVSRASQAGNHLSSPPRCRAAYLPVQSASKESQKTIIAQGVKLCQT